ncbi:MAG TPA: LPS export ABC transporter periplasmic protein LptC [Gammaproteobacteria bacterium]|nr:LPS export ABC transporter periplasmic protein LptC [Gammaproteobacteria bacterium]
MNIFSFKNSTTTLLFFIAFCLSAWSILLSRQSEPLTTHTDSNEPDAYMENIVATMMNKQGSPSLKIEAPKMIHYAEEDTTHINYPHVTIYRQSPEPWYINSDTADALNGTEQIVFSNNVVIHHPADIENPNTTMKTTSLSVFPDKQQASTSRPVTITQPETTIRAVGMLADLNDGTVKLLSEAKGDYVPTS